MRKINTDVWGVAYTEYDTMNNRTGASDLTDTDFEDFPPFVKNDMRTNGISNQYLSNEDLYIGYLNNPEQFDFSKYIDLSIGYVGINNPNLLTTRYGVPMPSPYDVYNPVLDPENCFLIKCDGKSIVPVVYMNCYGIMHDNTNSYVTYGTFANPYFTDGALSYNDKYVPAGNNNNGGQETQGQINSSNRNLFFSYWRDFGMRCVFGTIMVMYFDGTYDANTGLPNGVTKGRSLAWYEAQTTEWKEGHPLVGAWLNLNFRRSTTGLYNNTRPQNQCFMWDYSLGLKSDTTVFGTYYPDYIWQPQSTYQKNTNSYLPLLGRAKSGNSTEGGAICYVQWYTQLSGGGTARQSDILFGIDGVGQGVTTHVGLPTSNEGKKSFWVEMAYSEGNMELLRKSAASYGLFFTDGVSTDTGYDVLYAAGQDETRWTNEKMCLGVVNDKGFTDGTYTRGTGNEGANNFNWKTAMQSPYNPHQFNIYIGDKQVENIYIGNQSITAAFIGDQTL